MAKKKYDDLHFRGLMIQSEVNYKIRFVSRTIRKGKSLAVQRWEITDIETQILPLITQ